MRTSQGLPHSLAFKPFKRSKTENQRPTLKCLSIGTPKTINFPFVSNEKLMIFKVFQYSITL